MTLDLKNREKLTAQDLKTLGSAVALDDGEGPDKGPAQKGNRGGAPAGKGPKATMEPHPLPGDEPEGKEEPGEEPEEEGADGEGGAAGDEGAPPEEAEGDGAGDPGADGGAEGAEEGEEGEEGGQDEPQGGQEGQPRKKMGQKERLRLRLKAEKDRNAALEAELTMLSGLYPSAGAPAGQPSGQQAPAPQPVPVQTTDDPWTRVDQATLIGVLKGEVAADEAQRAFAVAEFSRRAALGAVDLRFQDAGRQNLRARAEEMARREYPECFTPGDPAKAIYDHLMKIHPAANVAPDAPLLLAGAAIGRASRIGVANRQKEVVGLRTQVRKARAAGALESGGPAPQGQSAKKAREDRQKMLHKAVHSGKNWYRGKDTNRVVTDLLG